MRVKNWHCNRAHKVAYADELDAKMALASRVWNDKGEVRVYRCPHSRHYHLTSMSNIPI